MKRRVFNICSNVMNKETGEYYLTEEQIKDTVSKHKTIKKYAYILHDKDKKEDGSLKEPHWHIVLQTTPVDHEMVASWFGLPSQFIQCPPGRNSFLDCTKYLTHESETEQAKGKYRYSDEEVKSNFDFRYELDKTESKDVQEVLHEVGYEGRSLRSVYNEEEDIFIKYSDRLMKLRNEYLKNLPVPEERIGFYVYGKGGVGKDLLSRGLARFLYPDKSEEELIFYPGTAGAEFMGYDGQPVIVWSDVRSGDLIKRFGRETVLNMFDCHPRGSLTNIKYGGVRLVNKYWILNGQEDYQTFLGGLMGEYTDRAGNEYKAEDKTQSYRRFPIIIPMREDEIELMFNTGFFNNSKNFYEYKTYVGTLNLYKELVETFRIDSEAYIEYNNKVFQPVNKNIELYEKGLGKDNKEKEKQMWDKIKVASSKRHRKPSYEEMDRYAQIKEEQENLQMQDIITDAYINGEELPPQNEDEQMDDITLCGMTIEEYCDEKERTND